MEIEKQQITKNIQKKLTLLMLSSIVITFVLFFAVIGAIIYKIRATNIPILQNQTIALDADDKIISEQINDDKIIFLIKSPKNYKNLIYNYKTGKKITQITFTN